MNDIDALTDTNALTDPDASTNTDVETATSFGCAECGAQLNVAAHERTTRCFYCASPNVVVREPSRDQPHPVFAIGFTVPPQQALEVAQRWVRSPLFAPNAFRQAKVDQIRGVYVPSYLYSASVHSRYQATIGEEYSVSSGNNSSVTETEWIALSGSHSSYVTDRIVTASRGIPNNELEAIEPYDLSRIARYTTALVSGWATEEPSMSAEECLQLARNEAIAAVGVRLASLMPGDKHKELTSDSTLHQEDLRLVLVPVWVLPVRYAEDKPPVRLIVNGQTGKLHGVAPVSATKVGFVLLCALIFIVAYSLLAPNGAFR